jgi:glycine C-acetyltransferase/8-amino-7-oxononanoate synthase
VLRDALAREGFDVSGACTHVVTVLVGSSATALGIVDAALGDGVLVEAVVPPLVPEDGSRLRVSAIASHTREELRGAARVLARAAVRRGFRPGAGVPIAAAPPQRLRPAA